MLQRVRSWNWWKIGFFVALFAFETAREIAVVEAATQVNLGATKMITHFGDLTTAEGKWVRNDAGEPLMPLLVMIECNQTEGKCTEADTRIWPGKYVMTPTIDIHPARFGPDTIEFQNNGPCVNYTIRIDVKAKEAYQVRTKTDNTSTLCNSFDRHLSARLGNGWDDVKSPTEGHFLPVLSITKAVLDTFQ